MSRSLRHLATLFLVPGLVLVAACGDDPADPSEVSITDFIGTWEWTVYNITSTCGTEAAWVADVTIARVGDSNTDVTASSRWKSDDPGPFAFSGTVSGNKLTIPGVTYTEAGGTLQAQHEVTLQKIGTLAGTETWTWSDGTTSCTGGSADITAARVD
jgi:hypothetical protein